MVFLWKLLRNKRFDYMNICLFGASSNKIDKKYIESVEVLGEAMGKRGHGLVFGGGANGLMGAVARGVYKTGGFIKGIAPSFFNVDGILFDKCTEFVYTETMRQRKQLMEESSDAFIITPGGIGTFEEYLEILTLKQLGRHNKPIAVFNIGGYYNDFEEMFEKAIGEGFINESCRDLERFFEDADEMLAYIENYSDKPIDIFETKCLDATSCTYKN